MLARVYVPFETKPFMKSSHFDVCCRLLQNEHSQRSGTVSEHERRRIHTRVFREHIRVLYNVVAFNLLLMH